MYFASAWLGSLTVWQLLPHLLLRRMRSSGSAVNVKSWIGVGNGTGRCWHSSDEQSTQLALMPTKDFWFAGSFDCPLGDLFGCLWHTVWQALCGRRLIAQPALQCAGVRPMSGSVDAFCCQPTQARQTALPRHTYACDTCEQKPLNATVSTRQYVTSQYVIKQDNSAMCPIAVSSHFIPQILCIAERVSISFNSISIQRSYKCSIPFVS